MVSPRSSCFFLFQYTTIYFFQLYTLQAAHFQEKESIEKVCGQAPYIDRHFGRVEMQRDYGFDPRGPEFLLSPKYGMHFYHRDISDDTFAASHDSFHETSQHIFGMILGAGVPQNTACEKETVVIDLLPRIVKERFGFVLNPKRQDKL